MNCHRVRELITPYLDQQLTGAEMLEMQRHFGRCRSCAEEYLALRQVRLLLRSLAPKTPPRAFPATLSTRLQEDNRRLPPLPRFPLTQRPRRLAIALAFCCFGVLTVAAPFAPATLDGGPRHRVSLLPMSSPSALFWSPWPTPALSVLPVGASSPDLAASNAPLIGGRRAYSLTQPPQPKAQTVLVSFSNGSDDTTRSPFRAPVTLTTFEAK